MTQSLSLFLRADGQFVAPSGIPTTSTSTNTLSYLTKSTTADITVSTTAWTDGPAVAQGTAGIWLAEGTLTFFGSAAGTTVWGQLWDGTTTIASGGTVTPSAGANLPLIIPLSGVLSSPAGNLRLSARINNGASSVTIKSNASGQSADSTITAMRIG